MAHDSSPDTPSKTADSHLPHSQESFSDTLLWAAGLTKSEADTLKTRMEKLDTRQSELNDRLKDANLGADERVNIESAIKLVETMQSTLAPEQKTLDRLAQMHSTHARDFATTGDKHNIYFMPTPAIIPGDDAVQIIRKSLMLAAATRASLTSASSVTAHRALKTIAPNRIGK